MTLVYKQLRAISKRLQFTHISELAAHWNNAPIYFERSLSTFWREVKHSRRVANTSWHSINI